ncbi:MAG: FecR domain-containing protein [Elusimicrobia bacterium]|nr:FecR domain-containing protein [Elusimicrobiota bacterium]
MTTRIGLLSAIFLLAAGPLLAADPKAPSARLVYVKGDVTVESEHGGGLGKTGARLDHGASVTTAQGAGAVIELPDGSRLKLRGSSRVAVTWPGANGSKSETLAEAFLSYGSVFAKITKRLAGRQFNVRTPSAVAAVRGTEFFTAYGRAKGKSRDLWVCVNEGAVELSTDKSKESLLVPAGKGVLIKAGVDLTKPQAYDWTKSLNWNMDAEKSPVEDETDLDGAYADLLDQDYR